MTPLAVQIHLDKDLMVALVTEIHHQQQISQAVAVAVLAQ
jgi:hypothetical protein